MHRLKAHGRVFLYAVIFGMLAYAVMQGLTVVHRLVFG